MSMNALDTALTKLAAASTAIEYTARPGLKDVEEAKKQAKAAAEILDSAHKLMSYGVYTVADAPADPGPALFDKYGGPAVIVAEIIEEKEIPLLPMPDLLGDFDQLPGEEQHRAFLDKRNALYEAGCEGVAASWYIDWDAAWEDSRLDTFARAVYALEHRQPVSCLFPTDEEMSTWRGQFAQPEPLPPLPDDLAMFAALDDTERLSLFEARLDKLAEGIPSGEMVDWDPWDFAWDTDSNDAWIRVLVAEGREQLSFTLPTDEERDAWLARYQPPAQPEPEPEESLDEAFNRYLLELEDAGVNEAGLTRKSWKKAESTWREAFGTDEDGTLKRLLWRLHKPGITWELPTDEEMAA